ncbi:EndA [Streptococcus pyogenes]|nr:EndA [Streptococcus pyogenes]
MIDGVNTDAARASVGTSAGKLLCVSDDFSSPQQEPDKVA